MGAKLTADMKRVVVEQRLAFVATFCPDGTPNLSPKGTISVWDDDHLVFADIRSPGTITNLGAMTGRNLFLLKSSDRAMANSWWDPVNLPTG